MHRPKKESIILLFTVGAGLLLRLWGINFGLPYQFHQDEPIVVNHALAYGAGDFNPHFFIIPPLASYILFFFYVLYFGILKIFHVVPGSQAFALSFFKDPTPFYLIARVVLGVAPSIASVYITYRWALKVVSRQAALFVVMLMAVIFLNTVNAHYAYTDNLLVMFIVLGLLFLCTWQHTLRIRSLVLFGVCAGLAAATKYNAALLVCSGLVAIFMVREKSMREKIRLSALVCIVMGATFILSNPYAAFDWSFFISSITGRIRHGYIGFSHHIRYSLFEGMGEVLSISGFVGLGFLLKNKFQKLFPSAVFLIVFSIHLVYASQPFPRYVLALIPLLCIGAAYALFDLISFRHKVRGGILLFWCACVTLLLPTVFKAVKADMLFSLTDTRILAARWIEKNIPESSLIALDHTFFSPPLVQTVVQLRNKQEIFNKQPELAHLKGKKLELQIVALARQKSYEVYYLIEGDEHSGQFLSFWPVIKNTLETLRGHTIEYVVFSNMNTLESTWGLHREIAQKYKPVAIFNPYRNAIFRESMDGIESTCMAIGTDELLSRIAPGPYIVVYKLI